jgi:biotin operon repressor
MKGHDMTQNNTFPPRLINGFKKLADDFEAHIRADERSRIAKKFADAFPSKPVAKPGLFPITDMHGEPLQEIGAQPVTYDPAAASDYVGQRLNETHRRLIAYLSQGTFYAVPTLAGHLNIKKESVYHYLSGIKKAGYEVEIRSTGNRKGGYVNIYRLAKAS